MKILDILNESTVSVEDVFTPDEQEQIVAGIKADDGSSREWEMEARRRLKEMGVNSVLNISPILQWMHRMDRELNPDKFAAPNVDPDAWDDYGKARARQDSSIVGQDRHGRPWTGD